MKDQQPAERDRLWRERLRQIRTAVEVLLHAAKAAEHEFSVQIGQVAASRRQSAINLVHYLAVRRHDLRAVQDELARVGLSSLGRMEAHVLASLHAVLRVLYELLGEPVPDELLDDPCVSFDAGAALLAEHADSVLGPSPRERKTRIMVTMASEAADAPELIPGLLSAGMDIMRINCAHDAPASWQHMAERLREAQKDQGKHCLIECDLAGPKLRTGPVEAGPAVVKWRPKRNELGQVTEEARVRFVGDTGAPGDKAGIPVDAGLLAKAHVGDVLLLVDARERKREMQVRDVHAGWCLCVTDRTAYVVPGTPVKLRRHRKTMARGTVGALPAKEQSIVLAVGDTLEVVRGEKPGRNATRDGEGNTTPAFISCKIPQVFDSVRTGQPILFDDGEIKGEICSVAEDRFGVRITSANKGKLGAAKGINLPESDLALPALTQEDIEHLEQVAPYADVVAMSFIQQTSDLDDLLREIGRLGATNLGLVLKIEKKPAFENLPALLLSAMRHPKFGVMIARGDLGVEVGFERMSEVQEEMLWLCEAAHVPVIWATQVLESLSKGGLASRAEVTDAAMASRAECVMLNKGPHVVETLGFLSDVIARIAEHHSKKSARLRKLGVAG